MSNSNSNDENNNNNKMFFESNRYVDRWPCTICLSTKYYTRIFGNWDTGESGWFCHNCVEDLQLEKKGFALLTGNIIPR